MSDDVINGNCKNCHSQRKVIEEQFKGTGFTQFDDYDAFLGCRRAVDEFLAIRPELKMQAIGESGKAYFIQKPR